VHKAAEAYGKLLLWVMNYECIPYRNKKKEAREKTSLELF
jgi:hypothetical protein